MGAENNSGFYKKLGAAAAGLLITAASMAAVPAIKDYEGRSLVPYYDIGGVLTYCDGETKDAKLGVKYTDKFCDGLTQKRALEFAQGVANTLQVPVSQETFTSLITYSYNIGMGNFKTSTTLREINAGHTTLGCYAMVKFSCITVSAGKGDRSAPPASYPGADCRTPTFNRTFSKGLYNRREKEKNKCLAGTEVKV